MDTVIESPSAHFLRVFESSSLPVREVRAVRTVWLNPARLVVFGLLGLSIFSALNTTRGVSDVITQVAHLICLFGGGWITHQILKNFRVVAGARTEHRFITGLILFLLFNPSNPWWIFLILGSITELEQRFLRTRVGPIINPAALGAFILSLSGYLPDWWGVNPGPKLHLWGGAATSIPMLLAGVLFAYAAYKYKKLSISILGVAGFSLAYLLLFQKSPWPIVADGTLAFFFLVMVLEPKTTPVQFNEKFWYSMIVGLGTAVLLRIHFLEAYTGALILGNILWSLWRSKFWIRTQVNHPVPPASPPAPQSPQPLQPPLVQSF